MNFTLDNIVIAALVLLTGLSTGLCFTWSNAVTSGIERLDTLSYLSAFQEMNRTILNPTFFIVFFGPFFLSIINLYVFRNSPSSILWLLITASALYFFGVVLVTIFGNVPLNEILDKTNLMSSTSEDLKELRETFESKWNRFHLIRTVTSIVSFLLLIFSLIQISKNNI